MVLLRINRQTPQPPDLPVSAKAYMAAKIAGEIEQARAFAEQAVANPGLIESIAKPNREKVLTGRAREVLDVTSRTAEQLYQIQERLNLDAAIEAARVLASLPTLSKAEVIK